MHEQQNQSRKGCRFPYPPKTYGDLFLCWVAVWLAAFALYLLLWGWP